MQRFRNYSRAGVTVALAALTACVEPFGGSNLQINFDMTVEVPSATGLMPPDTFLTAYAVTFVVEPDAGGEPVVVDSFPFPVVDFELRPLIDTGSPCFIELAGSRFPGLHVTQFATKLREATGVSDPNAPPTGTPPEVLTDILTADRRMGFLGPLESTVKAVTGTSNASYPVPGNRCANDGGEADRLPPIDCIDDESNELRLALCTELWANEPALYEGNDKVFTVPLNGDFFGTVDGMNPINLGFIGGAGFFVPTTLDDFDSLILNWQFKDLDGDGEPDYPDDFPDRSTIGFHFMQGTPRQETRGTVNVPLANDVFSLVTAEAVIFSDLDSDNVGF